MRVKLVYTHVLGSKSGYYDPGAKRFLHTFKRYRPNVPIELIVINCNDSNSNGMFDRIAAGYITYSGAGWDCGAYKHAADVLDCDFLICFNAFVYFWRHRWIEPFLQAFEQYGPGLYGPTASYEQRAHIRTPCIAFSVPFMRQYEYPIESRHDACEAEAGTTSFTQSALLKGLATKLVTETKCYDPPEWRSPENIFRKGDQSNVLVRDRHTLIYEQSDQDRKQHLQNLADGL